MWPASSTLLAILAAACGSKGPQSSSSAASRVAPALVASLGAAERERAPWRCAAADLPAPAAEQLGAWRVADHTVRGDKRELAIGVIADAGGADATTLAALRRLRAKLGDVDLVVALGGMGTTRADLEATLGAIARPDVPVIALEGDLEAVPEQIAAIAVLRDKHLPVLDGRAIRWIETPTVAIGTVPGAGAAERLLAGGDGCAWDGDDIVRIYTELARKPGLRVAALAEAPRQVIAGEPTGEIGLVPAKDSAIDVVLHGPQRPTPSAAASGGRDGAHIALSPGTSDATPRLHGGDTTRSPAAGLLAIRDGAWTWKPIVDR